ESVPKSPWLDDPARRPTAAVLVATLHACAGDFEAAKRGFHAARAIGGKRGRRYAMTILAALPKERQQRLIGELPMQEQQSWKSIERGSGTYYFGVTEGLVAAILDLLAERGIDVDDRSEAKIRACEHLPSLKRWFRRAVHATEVAELFKRGAPLTR